MHEWTEDQTAGPPHSLSSGPGRKHGQGGHRARGLATRRFEGHRRNGARTRCPLLDRGSRGEEATRYGQALIRRSLAVFDELKQGIKEIEFLSDPTPWERSSSGVPSRSPQAWWLASLTGFRVNIRSSGFKSCMSLTMRTSLLATGHFLSMLPASALKFSAGHTGLRTLPIELPSTRQPIALITLKKRCVEPSGTA